MHFFGGSSSSTLVLMHVVLQIVSSLRILTEDPDRPYVYSQLGDINLGVLIYSFIDCHNNTNVVSADRYQKVEAILFAVEAINNDSSLLPNVTLGVSVMDTCFTEFDTVDRTLQFLPSIPAPADDVRKYKRRFCHFSEASDKFNDSRDNGESGDNGESRQDGESGGDGESGSNGESRQDGESGDDSEYRQDGKSGDYGEYRQDGTSGDDSESGGNGEWDIVGIIDVTRSSVSIQLSYLCWIGKIPQLGVISSSDDLTDKGKHPYFFRIVSPDNYQMRILIEFIKSQEWTYFSVLYQAGNYGENAFQLIQTLAQQHGLGIATHHEVHINLTYEQSDAIIKDLLKHRKARVVVAIVALDTLTNVFEAILHNKARGKLIWIGTDIWGDQIVHYEHTDCLLGSFTTNFYSGRVPDPQFDSYFKKQKPSTSNNPWFTRYWESNFGCSVKNKTCDENQDITTSKGFEYMSGINFDIDSVYVYAYALHRLLSNKCPLSTGKAARKCVEREILLEYLKNGTFKGFTGPIKFDKNGDRAIQYVVSQIQLEKQLPKEVPVKIIDAQNPYSIRDVKPIEWNYFDNLDTPQSTKVRVTPLSVCSQDCEAREQFIQKVPECCWECRECPSNEILVNKTQCQRCPKFQWPSPLNNFSICLVISPNHSSMFDTGTIFFICCSGLGIACSLMVMVLYAVYRENGYIQFSSLKLTYVQLTAITLGYITIVVNTATPTPVSCGASSHMFFLSFNCLYAPLLAKTITVKQKYGQVKTRMIQKRDLPKYDYDLPTPLILIQVVMCVIVEMLFPTNTKLTERVDIHEKEKYVDLSCDVSIVGSVGFLGYNLLLVLLCSVHAFKTRNRRENFEESSFTTLFLSTNLVVWLAFAPSYFITSKPYLRTVFVCLILLINHSGALGFLFVSRLYAVFFMSENNNEHPEHTMNTGKLPMHESSTKNTEGSAV